MNKDEILDLIRVKELKHNVPRGLLEAVVSRESSFDINAKGADDEIGLAQLLMHGGALSDYEAKHEPLGDYWLPENNLEVAAWYLGKRIPQMLRHFKQQITIENRVIAYNAGIGRVVNGPVPLLTRGYVDYVKGYMESRKSTGSLVLLALAAAGLAFA